MATHLLTVEPDQDGIRLDNFLTAFLPEQSRSHVQRLIKDGRVRGPVPHFDRAPPCVREVYEVEIPTPVAAIPEPEAIPLRIVYEDEHLVVLDKPRGWWFIPERDTAAAHWSTRCCIT